MKLTWLGHSCFKIEKDSYCCVIDPYSDGSVPGLKPVREKANAVLCTHGHGDHNGTECVEIVKETVPCPFLIKELHTYHDEVHGAKRGENKIIILDDGESTVVHLGDLGCSLTEKEKELIKHADILLIPVGGYYTIDGCQAAELVRELKPMIAVPMHYRDDEKKFGYSEIGTLSEFTKYMDSVVEFSENQIDSSCLPTEQCVILRPLNTEV